MPAGDKLKEQGRVMSERTRALLVAAGSDGLSTPQAAKALGCKRQLAWWHLANCSAAFKGQTHFTPLSRWFANEADARAYVERVDAVYAAKQPNPKRVRFASSRVDEAMQLLSSVGTRGLDRHQAAERLNVAPNMAGTILTELTRRGLAKHRKMGAAGIRVYWLAENYQPKAPEPIKQKPAKIKKPSKPAKPAKVVKLPELLFKPAEKKKAPEKVVQAPIFTDATKYTRADAPKGRFHVDRAPSFFASMAPGSYLRTGSAIERAYS